MQNTHVVPSVANEEPTKILDWQRSNVTRAHDEVVASHPPHDGDDQGYLQAAHGWISNNIRPVYSLNEVQPASTTVRIRRGSCSQRLAVLESLARAHGIPTRVEGLWVSGEFWYPRFGAAVRPLLPRRILLAWPSFWLKRWVGVDEIHGSVAELARKNPRGFANSGETLFEAVASTAVDFAGRTPGCGVACDPRADLSKRVLARVGPFASRDELFASAPSLATSLRGRVFSLVWGGRGVR